MKRLLIVSGLALCFSTLPACAQHGCGMHYGGTHGPGFGMGGPGYGMGGTYGSWGHSRGQTSRGNGAWTGGANRTSGAALGTSSLNMQATPAAGAGGGFPWRYLGKIPGFGGLRSRGMRTKGTASVPETLQQNAPGRGYSTH